MQVSESGRIVLKNLFHFTDKIDTIPWEQFRPGVKIHRLYGNQKQGPSAALLLYEPGSGVPLHEHLGYEHLFILAEFQSDETGDTPAGTLVINPPGSAHSVCVPNGGLILAIWEKPVLFREPPAE
jgi:anti-sigma factor ChrR (cupin superfamily)